MYKGMAKAILHEFRPLWIVGDGPWACLALCKRLSVMLFKKEDQARAAKKEIDKFGCGSFCKTNHAVLDLRTMSSDDVFMALSKERQREFREKWAGRGNHESDIR